MGLAAAGRRCSTWRYTLEMSRTGSRHASRMPPTPETAWWVGRGLGSAAAPRGQSNRVITPGSSGSVLACRTLQHLGLAGLRMYSLQCMEGTRSHSLPLCVLPPQVESVGACFMTVEEVGQALAKRGLAGRFRHAYVAHTAFLAEQAQVRGWAELSCAVVLSWLSRRR